MWADTMTCHEQHQSERKRDHTLRPGDRYIRMVISLYLRSTKLCYCRNLQGKDICKEREMNVFARIKISILLASFPGSHSVCLGMRLLSYVPGQGQFTYFVWCSPPGALVYLDTGSVFHECQHEPQSPVFCENLHLPDCALHTPEELERTVLTTLRRNRTNRTNH